MDDIQPIKRAITHDPAYEAVAPDDFAATLAGRAARSGSNRSPFRIAGACGASQLPPRGRGRIR
jgi:hypothetical protein